MDDTKAERWSILGGPIFVVLAWVGGFLPGQPPNPDDSGREILAYFRDNSSAIGVGAFLALLGAIALLFWAGVLWRRMRAAEGGDPRLTVVAGLALVLAGALALGSGAVNAAIALRPDAFGPTGAAAFYALSGTVAASLWAPVAAMVLAVAYVTRRSGFLPAWIAYLGWATAVAALVSGWGVASDDGFWFAFAFVGFVLWSAWILAVSWSFWTPSAHGEASRQ